MAKFDLGSLLENVGEVLNDLVDGIADAVQDAVDSVVGLAVNALDSSDEDEDGFGVQDSAPEPPSWWSGDFPLTVLREDADSDNEHGDLADAFSRAFAGFGVSIVPEDTDTPADGPAEPPVNTGNPILQFLSQVPGLEDLRRFATTDKAATPDAEWWNQASPAQERFSRLAEDLGGLLNPKA